MDTDGSLNMICGRLLIEESIRCNVELFCISPGSRSTPLTLAAAENPKARTIVHFDERGAAYHALGAAKASGQPVALICTSGTALANYMPAVIEASMDNVPLLILTADRPPELHEISANQSIEQCAFFGEWVRNSFILPCPNSRFPLDLVLSTVDQAIADATGPGRGPVHINCMYREPFISCVSPAPEQLEGPIQDWLQQTTSWRNCPADVNDVPIAHVVPVIGKAQNGLIVVGRLADEADISAARRTCNQIKWPVWADIASNLRLHETTGCLLRSNEILDRLEPDVVLHIGGPVTSKRVPQLYDRIDGLELIQVQSGRTPFKPIHSQADILCGDIPAVLDALLSAGSTASSFASLQQASARCNTTINNEISRSKDLTGAHVCRTVFDRCSNGQVFLGNSFTVREADMFASPVPNPPRIFVNRGVSGIEGNIAAAAGICRGSCKDAVAIIGDLAAMHDLNSLALLRNLPARLIVVVVNNNGGGIFEILPISKQTEHFEKFFATPHDLSFVHAAEMFDLPYHAVCDLDGLGPALDNAFAAKSSSIVEITTNRKQTSRLYAHISNEIRAAIDP